MSGDASSPGRSGRTRRARRSPPADGGRTRLVGIVLSLGWFVGVLAIGPSGDLTAEASRMLAIFGAAVVLWITEAIPLAATSISVIFAEILLVSDEALVGLSDGYEAPPYASFYATLAHPVLILFLGGFVLAEASSKYRLDRNLAGAMLRPFGRRPGAILGGLMLITALLSMFMSNTATTAAMMAVVLPVVAGLEPGDPLRISLVLAVPIAANVGGIGTPVGSPPNAIALGRLADEGLPVDFIRWMGFGVPIVIVVLAASWALLVRRYPARADELDVRIGGEFDRSWQATVLYLTFAGTVIAWMTEPLHHVPSAVVGFVPVVVLLGSRVFDVDDLRRLNWHVLWLVGGGIALGNGVAATGLDDWLVGLVDWGSMATIVLILALAVVALTMSTVISNSATANLVVPIGVSLAVSDAVDLDPLLAGVVIALSCSLAMALPVSTPPNAVAYASGQIRTKDLATTGLTVGLLGLVLVVFVAPPIWRAVGLL